MAEKEEKKCLQVFTGAYKCLYEQKPLFEAVA